MNDNTIAYDCLWNEPLGWTPFGQDITCGEWDQIISWFIAKTALDTKKEDN